MSETKVREFWDDRARDSSISDVEVTHRDVWQRWLEIETVRRYLRPADRVLDVGCGAGYAANLLAPGVREVVGIDSSAEMIARARSHATEGRCSFEVQDVLTLSPGALGVFDVVLSSRCLINLSGWDEQQRAIRAIHSVLEPGGRFIFLEGSADGRRRLDAARVAAGLEEMPAVWHNVDFRENQLFPFLEPLFEVAERRHFGVYDFVSRIVHPLTVAPEPPQYGARINEVAARLAVDHQEFGDLSRVLLLVLSRRPD